MRIALSVLLLAGATLQAADTLKIFGYSWDVVQGSDWKVTSDGGEPMLALLSSRGPLPGPRRPIQFAVAQQNLRKFTLDVDVRPRQSSLMLVFAYQDPAHFDYAHLSVDTGIEQPVHNGIFHVFGGERVRISTQAGRAAFAATGRWYHVTLKYNGASGSVEARVDGQSVPALRAVDMSLSSGRIGVGSFDEVGDFKNLKISGETLANGAN